MISVYCCYNTDIILSPHKYQDAVSPSWSVLLTRAVELRRFSSPFTALDNTRDYSYLSKHDFTSSGASQIYASFKIP